VTNKFIELLSNMLRIAKEHSEFIEKYKEYLPAEMQEGFERDAKEITLHTVHTTCEIVKEIYNN
jgi:hypothetical protein